MLAWLACGLASATDITAGARIDAIFAPLTDGKSPGVAVLVRKDGRTIFEKGYGVRDLRTRAANDASTDFRLASFTKQFTAMATMLLVREGKLSYDDTLTKLFPGFPAYGRSITVRQLLTHTSGLADYEDVMEKTEKANGPLWTAQHQIRDDEVLQLLEQQPAGKFQPGTSWSYSNSGYVLLGLIAAKADGKTFDRVLHDRIFKPLGMAGTLAYVQGKNSVGNRASGHAKNGTRLVEEDQSPTSATLGDGGVYSNLADLAKWDESLRRHRLLALKDIAPALVPAKLADGSEPHWPMETGEDNLDPGKRVSYGFGWFLNSYKGRARMWHTGSTAGFRTAIERFTQENLTIVVLCNRTDLDANRLALQVADIFQ